MGSQGCGLAAAPHADADGEWTRTGQGSRARAGHGQPLSCNRSRARCTGRWLTRSWPSRRPGTRRVEAPLCATPAAQCQRAERQGEEPRSTSGRATGGALASAVRRVARSRGGRGTARGWRTASGRRAVCRRGLRGRCGIEPESGRARRSPAGTFVAVGAQVRVRRGADGRATRVGRRPGIRREMISRGAGEGTFTGPAFRAVRGRLTGLVRCGSAARVGRDRQAHGACLAEGGNAEWGAAAPATPTIATGWQR